MTKQWLFLSVLVSGFGMIFAMPPTASACDVEWANDESQIANYTNTAELIFVSSDYRVSQYYSFAVDVYLKGLEAGTTRLYAPCIPATEYESHIFFIVQNGLNHPYGGAYSYVDSEVVAMLPATQENMDAVVAITGEMNAPDRQLFWERIAMVFVLTIVFGWQYILAFLGIVFLVNVGLRNRQDKRQTVRKQKPKPE
ncbi:MAG: hypothetical protein AAFR67_01035 [Chloroflexota bacterium]